jgi:predicted CXXCH cytochrome family protein
MKIARLGVAIAALAIAMAPALAFHDDGVAHCNGCHTMHNSQNGNAMNGTTLDGDGNPTAGLPAGQGYADLLLFPNKSDVCLACHAGNNTYHVWADDPLVPGAEHGGGNFVFLEEDNINDGHAGASNPILGYASGHSLASGIKGTSSDPVLVTAPGGAYPAADMNCVSCHDPHGNQSFRLLYQDGQSTTSDTGTVINWTTTLDAVGMSVFAGSESNNFHNAYKDNYSEWCSTCHGDFHAASANLIHPSGELLKARQVAVYNAYAGTTDCVNNPPSGAVPCGTGAFATAYLHTVPFEDPGNTNTSTTGVSSTTSEVSCMSCHRAHATSSPDAGRWDFNVTGLAEDGVESGSYALPNPYDGNQRSLCNKCHAKDEYDALVDFTPPPAP